IWLLAADNSEELLLDRLGDWTNYALAYTDFVDRTDRCDLSGGSGEKNFVGNVEHLAWDTGVADWGFEIKRHIKDRIASDSRQYRVSERRSLQHAVANDKYVLARAFADVAIDIKRNAFDVAIEDGFHLNQLRVHVVGAGFRHCGQRVWSHTVPGGNAD